MPLRNKFVAMLVASAAASVGAGDFGAGATGLGRTTSMTTTAAVPYKKLEHKHASGTTVVRYIDATGTLFAVTWSGPFLPDLQELLGMHFASFSRAQERATGLHAPLVVRSDDVVIVAHGHMGAFAGWAWLPPRLPAGFDPRTLP
jgi:hypothetical protein